MFVVRSCAESSSWIHSANAAAAFVLQPSDVVDQRNVRVRIGVAALRKTPKPRGKSVSSAVAQEGLGLTHAWLGVEASDNADCAKGTLQGIERP